MEPERTSPQAEEQEDKFANLKKVTPLSKYLAMVLFIILPFVGGWIGYTYAPGKVVEVERLVQVEKLIEKEALPDQEKQFSSQTTDFDSGTVGDINADIQIIENPEIIKVTGSKQSVLNGDLSLVVPSGLVVREFLDDPSNLQVYISESGTMDDEIHGNSAFVIQVHVYPDTSVYDLSQKFTAHVQDAPISKVFLGNYEFLMVYDSAVDETFYVTRLDQERILTAGGGAYGNGSLSEEEIRGVLATLEISSGPDAAESRDSSADRVLDESGLSENLVQNAQDSINIDGVLYHTSLLRCPVGDDLTADLKEYKKYTNSKYGFEILLPEDAVELNFETRETAVLDGVSFDLMPDAVWKEFKPIFNITVYPRSDSSLEDFVIKNHKSRGLPGNLVKKVEICTLGAKGSIFFFEKPYAFQHALYFENDSYIFEVGWLMHIDGEESWANKFELVQRSFKLLK